MDVAYVGKTGANLPARTQCQSDDGGHAPGQPRRQPECAASLRGARRHPHVLARPARPTYDSLQTSLDRRFASGSASGSRTRSRRASTTPRRPTTRSTSSAPLSELDRPHLLNFNFMYELPFFKDTRRRRRRGTRGLAGHGRDVRLVRRAAVGRRLDRHRGRRQRQ